MPLRASDGEDSQSWGTPSHTVHCFWVSGIVCCKVHSYIMKLKNLLKIHCTPIHCSVSLWTHILAVDQKKFKGRGAILPKLLAHPSKFLTAWVPSFGYPYFFFLSPPIPLCFPGDWLGINPRDYVHVRQALYQLSYILSPASILLEEEKQQGDWLTEERRQVFEVWSGRRCEIIN